MKKRKKKSSRPKTSPPTKASKLNEGPAPSSSDSAEITDGRKEELPPWLAWTAGREFPPLESGLYLVPTPLGNLEDITLRALRTLHSAQLVAAEDTRSARKLFSAYQIPTPPIISLYRDNEDSRLNSILRALEEGKVVALLSEAGTPTISDPGFPTVRKVIESGYSVISLPGPSAVTTALAASGIPLHHFCFLGFLPQKAGKRLKVLQSYSEIPAAVVIYESPHKLHRLLEELEQTFGPRELCIARELTKKFEEYIRGPLPEVAKNLPEKIKGEITVIVAPPD